MNPAAQQLTDAQLLERTRAGDVTAYDELYRRHLADARRVARIVTDDREEAEEVVAEAFTRVLAKLREGSGPDEVLTPYLRTVIRRLAIDRHRASSREGNAADPAMLEELPTVDDEIPRATDRQLVREAFESLPERWQRVLWHTEIEGRPAATLTPALGSSPNAVAALAYRAREGLRQAFLAVHLAATAPAGCRPFVPKLAAYVREALPQDEDVAVAIHLDTCAHCRERRDELLVLVSDVRGVLAPALLGMPAAASGMASPESAGAAAIAGMGAAAGTADAGGAEATEPTEGLARFRPRGFIQVAATAVVSAAAAAAVAFAAVSALSPPSETDEPAAAPPVTSQQAATSASATATAEATETADDTPSPTEEPADEEDSLPPEVLNPPVRPVAENEEQPSSSGGTGNSSARSGPRTSPSDDKHDEPAADPKTKDREPKPAPNPQPNPPGSNDDRGNQNPGTPPASPWACDVVPALPWCD